MPYITSSTLDKFSGAQTVCNCHSWKESLTPLTVTTFSRSKFASRRSTIGDRLPSAHASAVLLHGLHAGGLLFTSAVGARALSECAAAGDARTIRGLFPRWWPAGRDLMAPLGLVAGLAHVACFRASRAPAAAVGAGAMAFVVAWTGGAMGGDIKRLLGKDTDGQAEACDAELLEATQTFCRLHHVRTVVSLSTFTWAVVAFTSPVVRK